MGLEAGRQALDVRAVQSAETVNRKPKIAVLGAGVIGLTTAVLAQQRGYDVTIYSSLPTTETTSTKAGASFKLHKVDESKDLEPMVLATWNYYEALEAVPQAGVRRYRHSIGSANPITDESLAELHLLAQQQPQRHDNPAEIPGGFAHAIEINTFHIDPRKFIQYLVKTFRENGGELFEGKTLTKPEDLETLPESVLINCTGLGSKELFGDENMVAVRGQIEETAPIPGMVDFSTNPPTVIFSASNDGGYIYHHTGPDGQLVAALGGTTQESDYDANPRKEDREGIRRKNRQLLAEQGVDAEDLEITHEVVGLRPYRRGGVRIERETVGSKLIVHNYGHGGAGFTLCWGSAELALGKLTPEDFK